VTLRAKGSLCNPVLQQAGGSGAVDDQRTAPAEFVEGLRIENIHRQRSHSVAEFAGCRCELGAITPAEQDFAGSRSEKLIDDGQPGCPVAADDAKTHCWTHRDFLSRAHFIASLFKSRAGGGPVPAGMTKPALHAVFDAGAKALEDVGRDQAGDIAAEAEDFFDHA
jgi:hypothetical protein